MFSEGQIVWSVSPGPARGGEGKQLLSEIFEIIEEIEFLRIQFDTLPK